jgi:hypothetical protein
VLSEAATEALTISENSSCSKVDLYTTAANEQPTLILSGVAAA